MKENVPKDRKAWETWKVDKRDNLERIYKKYKVMRKAWNYVKWIKLCKKYLVQKRKNKYIFRTKDFKDVEARAAWARA